MSAAAFVTILSTTNTKENAQQITKVLLANKVAACVQLLPIESYYTWKGAVCNDNEILLLIKTQHKHYPVVEALIVANHPYETPEIIQLPIEQGLPSYLQWIRSVS